MTKITRFIQCSFLAFCLSSFYFVHILNHGQATAIAAPTEPKVLGESTGFFRGSYAPPQTQPVYRVKNPSDFNSIKSKSFLVGDADSGEIIISSGEQEKLEIASITKLLTALLAYENLNLEEKNLVKSEDAVNISPEIRLAPGDRVKTINLLESMIIGSANDSANMLKRLLEEKTANSMDKLMNSKANSVGMAASHFDNPFGFDSPHNYSTAKDVFLLVNEALKLSEFDFIGRMQKYEFAGELGKKYQIKTTNKLLATNPDIYAVKTGQTPQSGGSMIIRLTHAGRRLVLIVLGSSEREKDTLNLKKMVEDNIVRE